MSTLHRFARVLSRHHMYPPSHRIPSQVLEQLHTTCSRQSDRHPTALTNILASEVPPPVQVTSVSDTGIKLADGLVLKGSVVFLEGRVYLWDVPRGGFNVELARSMGSKGADVGAEKWDGWTREHWSIFEVVVPRPEILVFGTGARMELVPHNIRSYVKGLGIQMDVMNTKNASSTYNLLAEEGRRVAAALLPLVPKVWERQRES